MARDYIQRKYVEVVEKVNPEWDVWELDGKQYFTWDAMIRETLKAGKRVPTDPEFDSIPYEELIKTGPSGGRDTDGSYNGRAFHAFLWSSSASDASTAWLRYFNYSMPSVYRNGYTKAYGFSVRCLQD